MTLHVRYELRCDWCKNLCSEPQEYRFATPYGSSLSLPKLAPYVVGVNHMCDNCMSIARAELREKVLGLPRET